MIYDVGGMGSTPTRFRQKPEPSVPKGLNLAGVPA